MDLKGGERIVSRRETKVLIKKAKKAYKSKSDNDYKTLGKYMFKVFDFFKNKQNSLLFYNKNLVPQIANFRKIGVFGLTLFNSNFTR